MSDLFYSVISNIWPIFLAVIFFGGSIFVHELGHFLAARRRGVLVERFSIGFGRPIFSWKGKDGVEYRIAWIPLGGYVLLPQLADLSEIEGEAVKPAAALPPVPYGSKMLVFVAGAAFNLLFAFALACIIWVVGQPEVAQLATTRIGYVTPTVTLADGTSVVSPAKLAGLKMGDRVLAIDGHVVQNWPDLNETLVMSSGHGTDGARKAIFTIDRDGKTIEVVLYPRLAGSEGNRKVGIGPAYDLVVAKVAKDSPAALAGLKNDDTVLSVNGAPELSIDSFSDDLAASAGKSVNVEIVRAGQRMTLPMLATATAGDKPPAGLDFALQIITTHPSPFSQIGEQIGDTFRTLWSLINPRSDIGLSKLSGPVSIVHILYSEAKVGIVQVLVFTILLNVNFAIFNLLPIPVLDGGHMLFATFGKLRGRALSMNLIANAQSVFFVVLISLIVYVTSFDIRRMIRDAHSDSTTTAAPAQPTKP